MGGNPSKTCLGSPDSFWRLKTTNPVVILIERCSEAFGGICCCATASKKLGTDAIQVLEWVGTHRKHLSGHQIHIAVEND